MTWGGITREEFGRALWEVIKACGGVMQLRANKNMNPMRIKSGQLTEWEKQEQQLIAIIAKQFPSLLPEDQLSVLANYSWVAQI